MSLYSHVETVRNIVGSEHFRCLHVPTRPLIIIINYEHVCTVFFFQFVVFDGKINFQTYLLQGDANYDIANNRAIFDNKT